MAPPVLIIGQGLAGTSLAWQLWRRGTRFRIVDPDEPVTSSKIAAGLIAPITGMRLSLHENYAAWLCEAVRFYRDRERALGVRLLHARGHLHLFKNEGAQARWQKRKQELAVQPFIHRKAPRIPHDVFHHEHGGVQTRHAGWLDTAAYLSASQRAFDSLGCFMRGTVEQQDLIHTKDGVSWHGEDFGHAVFCTGWRAARMPWFDWVPFEPARGTILTARVDLHGERRLINSGCWVVPLDDDIARIGSTYETRFTDPHGFDPEAMNELHAKIARLIKTPVQIEAQASAVRPVIRLQRTLIGTHPAHPRIGFFNGLGSKGALRAPAFARTLVEHLLDARPLPPGMDVRANL